MQTRQARFLLIALFLLLMPVGMVAGQSSSTNYIVQRVATTGGSSAESANFRTTATLGQPATDLASSANYKLSSGFLFASETIVPTAVTVDSATTTSLIPFWLLLASAFILLLLAAWLHRRLPS